MSGATLVWVLQRAFGLSREAIGHALRLLVEPGNVVADKDAVDAGLVMLHLGGDFADGVIANQGWQMRAQEVGSVDRQAVRLAGLTGVRARLLA